MKKHLRRRTLLWGLAVLVVGFLVFTYAKQPTNDRVWSANQAVLPYAEITDDLITIYNIRNTTYRTRQDYTTAHYDKTFALADVRSVDYVIEPFLDQGLAHVFLSFGLADGSYFSVSVEARLEADEKFRLVPSLFRQYELIYTIADERDILGLRALYRGNQILLYPTVTTPKQTQQLLLSILNRVNDLRDTPEFFNPITNSCVVNVVNNINNVANNKISRFDHRLIFTTKSDALAYEIGLLDNNVPLAELRQRHDVTDLIKENIAAPNFSAVIRAGHATTATGR